VGVQAHVRYVLDPASVRELKTDPQVEKYIRDVGEQFARQLREVTPVHSGAGAASITAHDSRAQGATDVGWDKTHWYLIFPEYGTKFQPAQRFARDLLYDNYRID